MKNSIPHKAQSRPFHIGLALLWLLMAAPSWAQLEPCGFYEVDNKPGYSIVDLRFVASKWPDVGTFPTVPDHNGDGLLNLIDLVLQANCKDNLAPGLVGSYYGFQTGQAGQTLNFPNIDTLTFAPTVIRAVDRIEDFQGWNAFLNSDMRDFFAARFEGWLLVPETATYTLNISGREGMRVRLDNVQIMDFDGSPRNDSATLQLSYGLHPIVIDYYARGDSQASFSWSSTGTIVGSTNVTVGPDYLFHEQKAVPEHTISDLNIVFDPPTGSIVNTGKPRIQAWLLGHHGDVALKFKGSNKVLYDGKMDVSNVQLVAGLNSIPYEYTNAAGDKLTGTYNLTWDAVPQTAPGLITRVFADDFWQGVVPQTTGLKPIVAGVSPGCQLIPDSNGNVFINNQFIDGGTIVEFEGILRTSSDGDYTFRIEDGAGALFINGETVCAIEHDYPGQWRNQVTMYLPLGRHHFRLRTSSVWGSPRMRVFWTRPGNSEALLPNDRFLHDITAVPQVPSYSASTGTGSRQKVDQVVEYVFDPALPFNDTSGSDFHLPYDARAYVRSGGGLTYKTTGGTGSIQAGSQLAARIKDGASFSLEVDFVYNDVMDWHERRLLSLTSRWDTLVTLYTQDNDIYFEMRDSAGNSDRATASNVLTDGGRFHVVGTFNGNNLTLWVNGNQAGSVGFTPDLDLWPSQVSLNVGQTFFRASDPSTWGLQLKGSILVASAYLQRLGTGGVSTNRTANLAINPTPGPLVHAAAPQFPPAGTSPADLDTAFHVLNRTSFGPSPTSINEILNLGVDAYLNQQLDPDSISDTALQIQLNSGIFIPTKYRRDLQGMTTYRMTSSRRQLLEVMTQFWENHFNTQSDKTNDLVEEYAENERFRSLAFGDFVELLKASAMHMPMTVYLDSDSNIVGAANENYAREILELHSYGVNNGYTQQDIVEAARCFTGWTVRNGKFYFDAGLHDYGSKSLLGITIPAGGGLSDGLQIIEHLAADPHAADYITWKLCQVFIDDDPPSDVLSAAATTFSSSGGNIAQVLQTIFSHARFRTDLNYRSNKIKNPLEFGVSLMRATETPPAYNSLAAYLTPMGMDLFNYADPTGFDEEGIGWMDTNALLSRWNMVNDFTTNRLNGHTPAVNLKALKERYGWVTYDHVLDFFENITTHGADPAGTRAIAQSWLTNDNPGAFTLDNATLDGRVRQTLGLYLRMPELNKN